MTLWTGLFPAVTTKLDQDGSVNLRATNDSVDRLVRNGASGVIVLPMLGENASMKPTALRG
jgi:4-hydroxy-tetrahydrodipicolinate synthase